MGQSSLEIKWCIFVCVKKEQIDIWWPKGVTVTEIAHAHWYPHYLFLSFCKITLYYTASPTVRSGHVTEFRLIEWYRMWYIPPLGLSHKIGYSPFIFSLSPDGLKVIQRGLKTLDFRRDTRLSNCVVQNSCHTDPYQYAMWARNKKVVSH